MSNLKLGFYSSIIATILTTIFALSMVLGNNSLSFGSCMILSWSYVTLTCAFVTNVSNGKKSLGYAGVIFAAIYSAFITLVYYTQLTTVNQNAASNEILRVLRFEPGSWMFAFDLMGYAMMAISTFFIGVSLDAKTRAYKWLKGLLIAHGLFAPMCIIFPMINVFQNTQNVENTSIIGMIGLVGWCVYFTQQWFWLPYTFIGSQKYLGADVVSAACLWRRATLHNNGFTQGLESICMK